MKRLLIKTVKQVGKFLRESFYNGENLEKVKIKGFKDYAIKADYIAEEIYLSNFSNLDVKIISEERGVKNSKNSSEILLIDPLDGTINFSRNLPFFCTQLAYLGSDKKIGIIYIPITNELFYGEENKGSFLNGERIFVSGNNNLKNCFIDLGSRILLDFGRKIRKAYFRSISSFGISAAYIACGRLDAYISFFNKPWDIYPGKIIVESANGKATDIFGREITFRTKNIIFSNGLIHREILKYAYKGSLLKKF